MTSITRTNMPYCILTEMSSPADRCREDNCRGDDRRGDDRRRSDEDRVSKPSGSLCPFCHRHHAKAQCPQSMCPECLVAVQATGTALKGSAMGATCTAMSPTVARVIQKESFMTPDICLVSLQEKPRLSRYRTPYASRCPASLFHTGNERRKPRSNLLRASCRARHPWPTPGTPGRSHARRLPHRPGVR